MTKKAAIIGAGVGGLSAALALRALGVACAVFEQAPALDDIGAGIQLSPNAMRVLEAFGVGVQVAALASEPHAAVIRDYKTGAAQMTQPLKGFCETRYGAKYLHIHRADLREVLYDAARALGVSIHFGVRVEGYEETGASIAPLIDGRAADAVDRLIGADGIHSVVRTQMLGAEKPRFTGQVAWRGLVPVAKLPAACIPPDATVWAGPGRHFVAYYVRGGALVNFVAVEERASWVPEDWHTKGDMDMLRRAFAGWDSRIATLLTACDECWLWGLFDRAPLRVWHEGRAVLLGDACHPMLPFMAQGAAAAIEDAFVLARSDTLADYEAARKPRATMLQSVSRRNARLFHRRGVSRKVQFRLAALLPSLARRRFDKIYGVLEV